MSSNYQLKQNLLKKENIRSKMNGNLGNSNNINKKNQCLYKKEILSSLIRLPTKIKQDGVLKSYNIENIQKERQNNKIKPITVNLNKSIKKSKIISPNKENNNINIFSNRKLLKLENLINNLNDIFNQIQILFFNGKNCFNECNDWIELFYNNIDFIIKLIHPNDNINLINYSLNLLIFSIIIISDISKENKSQYYIEEVKNMINIFIKLHESFFEKCKNTIQNNFEQQSNILSNSSNNLYTNLCKIVFEYQNINPIITKEIIFLFKQLKIININEIFDFYQSKIKQLILNNNISPQFNYNTINSNINNNFNTINTFNNKNNLNVCYEFPKNYENQIFTQQDHINNIQNQINNFNIQNNPNLNNNIINAMNINNKYSSNTSNSSPIPKISKIGPGNVLTTDINYIGAALTNSGVVFPFRKTKAIRQKEKSQRIRSISSNNNIYLNNFPYIDFNNLDYNNQNNIGFQNIQFISNNENNYSHNTSPIYHPNIYNKDFDYKNEIKKYENTPHFKTPQFINNYEINSIKLNPKIKNDKITFGNENYYDYYNNNNKNIGSINLTLAKSNKKIKNFNKTNYANINTPLIPFSPDKPYTLVINLDDILVFVPKGTNTIYLRPGLREFLESISLYYELIVFSFGIKDYADQIINFIEIDEKFFDYRLYRQNNNYFNEKYYKDIKKLGRDLKKTIIIDNENDNIENKIVVNNFVVNDDSDEINDRVLYNLIDILIKIANDEPDDIRVCLRKNRNEINNIISQQINNN